MYRRDGTTRGKKRCDAMKLFSLQENVSQIHARPVDRACLCRKPDRFAFDTPAQPVEKEQFLDWLSWGVESKAIPVPASGSRLSVSGTRSPLFRQPPQAA